MSHHVIVEADDDRDDVMAADIMRALIEAYPGHPWHIRIGGGVLIIKHMKVSGRIGIARKYNRLTWDAGARKREVVMAAGEYLERAGLTRGKVKEGEAVIALEGAEMKHLLPAATRVMH